MPPEDQTTPSNGQPLTFAKTKHGRLGPTLGILVLLLVLVLGALFLRGSMLAGKEDAIRDSQDLETIPTSDEHGATEADIENADPVEENSSDTYGEVEVGVEEGIEVQ